MSKAESSLKKWGNGWLNCGAVFLFLSAFGFVINQLNYIPPYLDLPSINASLERKENWNTRTRYSSNSGTDIYISGLRLNIGICILALNNIENGDKLLIKYKPVSFARIDGRALEIVKDNQVLCDYRASKLDSQREHKQGLWWIGSFFILGAACILFWFFRRKSN